MRAAEPPDRFATIAFVYSQPELAVLLSLLTNEDIYVLPIGRDHASVAWYLTVALGGIEIRVHAADAAAARALLAGIDRTPFRGRILFDNRLLDVAAVLLLLLAGLFLPPARMPAHFVLESPAVRRAS